MILYVFYIYNKFPNSSSPKHNLGSNKGKWWNCILIYHLSLWKEAIPKKTVSTIYIFSVGSTKKKKRGNVFSKHKELVNKRQHMRVMRLPPVIGSHGHITLQDHFSIKSRKAFTPKSNIFYASALTNTTYTQ